MGASRGCAPQSQALGARASAPLSGERAFCNLQLRPQSWSHETDVHRAAGRHQRLAREPGEESSRGAADRDGEAVERLLASGLPRQPRSRNFPVGGTSMPSDAKTLLRIGYGLVPIVAGADKVTNLLVDWDRYLSPKVERRLPVDGRTFMRLVGVIEIGAGLLVLRRPRVGGAVMAGRFAARAGDPLFLGRNLHNAARRSRLAGGAAGPAGRAGALPRGEGGRPP